MRWALMIKIALRTLRRTMVRSMLACLGIIIGIAALIAMITIFQSGVAHGQKALTQRNERQMTLSAAPRRSAVPMPGVREVPLRDRLSEEDYAAIRHTISGLSAVSPVLLISETARAAGREVQVMLRGTDEDGLLLDPVAPRQLAHGAMFGEADVRGSSSVCLITETLAKELFGAEDPLGRFLTLSGAPFAIVGTVESRQHAGEPDKDDLELFLPYTSVLRRLNPNTIMRIVMEVDQMDDIGPVRTAVTELMESRRGTRNAEFVITDITAVRARQSEAAMLVARILASITAISLVVGGVGIMNIMYANVTERTREIGIRLAIGTRSREILAEFLIESLILCLAGGVIGILTGIGCAGAVVLMFNWPFSFSIYAVILAFASSVGVGLIFGYLPARSAAALRPIEALRYE